MQVAVHDARSGDCVFSLAALEQAVTALAFVPDQPWLAVAALSDQIFVLDYVKKQHTPWSAMVRKTDRRNKEEN